MTKGIFITGTDTGVGKTVIAAGIIRALGRKGVRVGAMKPVETGCIQSIPADGMFLREIAGMDDPVELITPLRFSHPLAPMVASELEGKHVALDAIMHAYNVLKAKYEFLVVEGAGGLMVPLKESFFISDLIKMLDLPVIIVAREGLGTLNHTLLTVIHALREGIEVRGVIINSSVPSGDTMAERTNPDVLRRICPVPILGVIKRVEPVAPEPSGAAVDAVADSLSEETVGMLLGER